jgi:hypothetical protein
MRTFAVMSLFTLAPAVVFTRAAGAQQVQPPPPGQVALADPYQMPDPYQPPDPYDTAADPSQIDWPQDTTAEEPAVDDYDDGYDPQAYSEFQDDLAPYGNWIDDGTYGRVWQPEGSLVGAEFTPYYTGGHWALTEFGWTWVSDWNWGWAPFHYGRWIVVSGYGWCWVPGTIWGPAWVAWRAGDGYVGWAALPPRGVSVTVTYGARSPWRFSRGADLGASRPRCVPTQDARGMFRRTTLVTNDRVLNHRGTTVHINAGPRHVTNAVPVRLTAVAPQAFPQRAILPHRGATMSARPWIRAATGGGGPANNGGAGRPAGAGGLVDPSPGRAAGRTPALGRTPARIAPPTPYSSYASPHLYNPPRPVAPSARASNQPAFASTASRTYNPPAGNGAPHIYNPPAATAGTHIYNPPAASPAPHISNPAPVSSAPHTFGPAPTYGTPHTFGGSPARVYNPPPRSFPSSPAVNPPRTFAPPVQHAPAPPAHQTFAPPAHAMPPAHGFSAPAASGWSGHAGGGGAQLGGVRRR